jgi:hypothetical protein
VTKLFDRFFTCGLILHRFVTMPFGMASTAGVNTAVTKQFYVEGIRGTAARGPRYAAALGLTNMSGREFLAKERQT